MIDATLYLSCLLVVRFLINMLINYHGERRECLSIFPSDIQTPKMTLKVLGNATFYKPI